MKALILLLLFSGHLHAEKFSHAFLWGSGVSDFATTRYAIGQGAMEANPVMGSHPVRQAAFLTGGVVLCELTTRYLDKRGHPKMGTLLRYVTGGIHFGASVNNIVVGVRLSKRR